MQEAGTGRFDVVVVGAGINGTGIARDAARRGLKTLLLDKTDIAAGTTSWSSRLIHGGLRYLEYAEIPLVYESLQERETLLRIAPHLVHPQPLTLPIYDYSPRGPLMIRAGMVAYDLLSWNKSLPRHRMYSRHGARSHERGLNPDGLKGAARYYDAQVEFPERLSVENVIDAVSHGAVVHTGALVTGLDLEAGVIRGVKYQTADGVEHHVRTMSVVNVAGPWVDEVLREAGVQGKAMPLLGVTRGTHIVVQRFPGAPADALYVEARSDGRPFFIIPWNGLYLIGTTDERYTGDPDAVMPTEEELAYLIEETNSVIPAAGLTRESVCYAYAGLRPLPHQRAGSESGITRRHVIHDHAPQVRGLLSIVGGKLTTFRNLSEQAVDALGGLLGRSIRPSTTASSSLPGAVDNFTSFATDFVAGRPDWLCEETATRLLRTYGARATRVLELANGDPSLKTKLGAVGHGIGAEVVLALEDEFAVTLSDIMMRRTMLGYAADAGSGSTNAVATIAASVRGWDDARLQEELQAHQRWMQRFMPAW